MSSTITIRTDEDLSRALRVLTEDGRSVSDAVRAAVVHAARAASAEAVRREAESLAQDEGDRREMARVLRDMESLRAR